MDDSIQSVQERPWYIVQRWQEYRGEVRANILRMITILVFYGIHVYSYHRLGTVPESLHRAITSVVVAWSLVVLLVFFCLQRNFFPHWLKYFTTVMDVILLTWVVTLGAAPSSPVVVAYFVIIALSGVRIKLRLVWCATISCVAAYLFVVAAAQNDWWDNGQFLVGREEVLMVTAGLIVTGIVVGQIVRCAKEMTGDYLTRAGRAASSSASESDA